MTIAHAFADAAERCVGRPFRLYGRTPESGFDCVGLVAWCCLQSGMRPVLPRTYALRNTRASFVEPFLSKSGFAPVFERESASDLIVVRTGPSQVHFMVAGCDGHFVHAHAGLRKVVRTDTLQWPVIARWHIASLNQE